jgi:hypothetical protein
MYMERPIGEIFCKASTNLKRLAVMDSKSQFTLCTGVCNEARLRLDTAYPERRAHGELWLSCWLMITASAVVMVSS